jgi:hypothetical protein
VGASPCDAEAEEPCRGREENREAWQASPLGRNRQSCGTKQAQNGKSVERTTNVAILKEQTHRIEYGRAMWEIPVASIRISYSLSQAKKSLMH